MANENQSVDAAIVQQLEYYFGDCNLPRDKFLQEKIKLDDGWITIETLLTFNRLAKISTDQEAIAKAVKGADSEIISISEDGIKIRRNIRNPAPENFHEYFQKIKPMTVLMEGFPPDTTLDQIMEFAKKYGHVENVLMRRTKPDCLFKGSVHITYKSREEAETAQKSEDKFGESDLTKIWQDDFWRYKHKVAKHSMSDTGRSPRPAGSQLRQRRSENNLSNGDEQVHPPNPLLLGMRKGFFGKSVSNVVESPEPGSEKPTTTPAEGNPALLQGMRKGLFGKSVSKVVESPEPGSEKPTTTPAEGNPAGDSAYDKEEPTPSVSNTAEPEASESTEVKMDEVNESEKPRMTAPSVTIVTPTKSADSDVEMNEEGSDSQDDSTPLFRGMMFILTSAQRDGGSTNFKKKIMRDFIQQSQGLVFEDFCEVDSHPSMKPFLISDTHYRTHKYLSAMARGVPCVSHEWILKCRESCSLVDYTEFLLPAGISLLDYETYPLPTNQGNLLKGKLVLVHSNNRPSSAKALSFVQIWEPMIGLLGGRAVTEKDAEKFKLDIVLSDASASPNLLEKARAGNALIVSSEWLIQGIIMDQLPEPNAHPRFQFDGSAAAQR